MDTRQAIVVLVTLILATAFLFIWKRRDSGVLPDDRKP
jgi:hypothetical protein